VDRLVKNRSAAYAVVRRGRMIIGLLEGLTLTDVGRRLGCSEFVVLSYLSPNGAPHPTLFGAEEQTFA
jgi:hypothetical protein